MSGRQATSNIISGDFVLSVGKPALAIPKKWVWAKLDEVATLATGHTPSRKIPSYWGGEIPWMAVGDARKYDGKKIYETKEYTNELGLSKSAAVLLPENTVCLSRTASIGYSILLGRPMATSQGFVNWICSELLNPRYLQCIFLAEKRFLYAISEGTAHTTIYFPEVKAFHIALPPTAEQNRIVAKLDNLFAQLENIKTGINNLKAIAGKFTYSCLVDSKKNKFYPREKIGHFLEEGTERIGQGWQRFRLIGVSAKEGITDLRIGQKESFEKYKIVRPGDFIYNTMRVNIGSIAIYNGSENALTSPDYVVFRVVKNVSSQLLINFLKSDQGLLEIGANTKGSVRARLYFSALSQIRMPIAPTEIQNLAENFLRIFNSNLKALKALNNGTLNDLSQAILHKAFKGELSEQLESDGNAEELLKQIAKSKIKTTMWKKK